MNFNKKIIFRWIKVIIIIYCGIGIGLYYLQDKFLIHPIKLPADHVFKFDMPSRELMIPLNKEDTISLVQFLPADSVRRGVVLYFHGNMNNIETYASSAETFTSHGYEVWMCDYPGFGKSTGEFTENKLYDIADQVNRLALRKYHADSIIVYGRSFGTGIAAYLASVSNPKQLILETPYPSIPDLYDRYIFMYPTTYMSKYKIPTNKFLLDVKAPVTILHGTDDEVITYSCAAKLKKSLKSIDKFYTIEGGSHNDLGNFPQYQKVLDSLLK